QLVCEGFRDVVTYVLPNLLLVPIYHCFYYFEQIQALEHSTNDSDDKEAFSQVVSAITPIKLILENRAAMLPKNRPSEASLRISWRGGLQMEKMKDIEESIEGWWGKTITQTCNEFIYEGDLTRVMGKRSSERRVFLFDSLLLCCKSNQARRPMPAVSPHEYRLKERILLRKSTVTDDESSDCQFSVDDGETKHIFCAHSSEEKRAWMAHLVRLQYRSTYDRMLDQLMREEASQLPVRYPSKEEYRYMEPDSPDNLVLEGEGQIPQIKGGTVLKLVERLTYHLYYVPGFTKTFLTTFRSFCKPRLLLELLVERYNIPEPPPTEAQLAAIERGEIVSRDDLKRFRKEYAQPIQLRVMNVIRQWLEHHWYDFESDWELLGSVRQFVSSVRGKNMQKWARTMEKIIAKKIASEEDIPMPSFRNDPPPVEWHITHDAEKYSIMSLHPIEVARQLTLLEFDLYRKVQSSELVGTVWTKVGKETSSPNLLRMIHWCTTITRWVSRSIVETKNFEERTSVMSRAIEIMQVLKQLNNFNGLLEFVAAFNSSPIHRLNHTKQHLPDRLVKGLKECMDLCDPRLTKCLEKLRSCDPPCVPFVGTFLTNILKTEEGNPHLLPNYPEHLELINFGKRRMVAAIMQDIQQYQNQPYNLLPVNDIRDYLINLNPLEGQTEKQFNDYIFACSLEVEPRQAERPARLPRSMSDKEMKSPGIVPSKKSGKTLFRDESKMSLFERRNSTNEDEASTSTVENHPISVVPEEPPSPVPDEPRPPPRPPRQPIHDLVSAPPIMAQSTGVFTFDHPPLVRGTSEAPRPLHNPPKDTPPPIPPRGMPQYPNVPQNDAPPPIPRRQPSAPA
uniref:Uncharacterized protein n=1 Tax=Ciona intestinalis TaxID=7719 RepID=F6WZA5_CIOIN